MPGFGVPRARQRPRFQHDGAGLRGYADRRHRIVLRKGRCRDRAGRDRQQEQRAEFRVHADAP